MRKNKTYFIPLLVAAMTFWLVVLDGQHSKIRYSLEYNVPYQFVTMDEKPDDCEWPMPPIGNKHCHYEIQVSMVQISTANDGEHIYSLDDGETWQPDDNDNPARRAVHLSWLKLPGNY